MKHLKYILITIALANLCNYAHAQKNKNYYEKPEQWYQIALADGVETHIDTTNISRDRAVVYAYEKRVFTTPESKRKYVNRIRNAYAKMGTPDKANKWRDFQYCVYYSMYDCTNKRFRILFVEDFDSKRKRISKTLPPKGTARWIDIELESVGDYTFFYVCDYQGAHEEEAKMRERSRRKTEKKRQEIRRAQYE